MSDPQNNSHDRRPLLPNRNFGLGPWSTFFGTLFGRRYNAVPHSIDVETSSPSDDSTSESEPRMEPSTSTRNEETTDESSPATSAASIVAHEEAEISNASESLPESSRAAINGSASTVHGMTRSVSRSNSSGDSSEKICLICLEPLSQEDFESGDAMRLQCQCKGDAALRHKECAQKWVDVKGDLTCDVCGSTIANLNAPRPRSDAGSQQPSDDPTDSTRGRYPSATDVFDCIRMTWIVTIVCILFFHLHLISALVAGLLFAVLYTWSCQLLRCTQQIGQNGVNGQGLENRDQMQRDERHETMAVQAVPAIVIV